MVSPRTTDIGRSASVASQVLARSEPQPYCRHRACRNETVVDLAFMAVAMQRTDLLRRAVQVRDDRQLRVKCREYRPSFDGPMVVRRVA